jgi:hypothetical protein
VGRTRTAPPGTYDSLTPNALRWGYGLWHDPCLAQAQRQIRLDYLVQGIQTASLSASHFLAASSWLILSMSTSAAICPICSVVNETLLKIV